MKNYKTRLAQLSKSRAGRRGGELSIVITFFFDEMLSWVYGGKQGPRPEPGPPVEYGLGQGQRMSRQISEKFDAALEKGYGSPNWERTLARSGMEDIPLEDGVPPRVIYLERYLTIARDAYPGADQFTAAERNEIARLRANGDNGGGDIGDQIESGGVE